MKAAIYQSYGPPEVVHVEEIETPKIKPHEFLVKVHVATVNRTDCGFRSAEYVVSRLFSGLLKPRIPVLGNEFSGEIVETGALVRAYRVGDRVFGYNDTSFGAHAEYLVARETDALDLVPDNLSYMEAAPLTEGAHYALCNIRAAGVKPGQTVMVYGATGAIGSAAVQLLRHLNTEVTAVCHPDRISLVRSLGAEEVRDYLSGNFTDTEKRYDFIFDAVGKSSFGECRKILKPTGRYISTEPGKNGENIFLAIAHKFSSGKRVLFPIPQVKKEDIAWLGELARKGIFKPLADRTYPLSEIVEAYRYVETGQKTGNVLLLPGK